MYKRGDISIRYVVLFALAIIVLIVVILIFQSGASDFAAKIKNLIKEIWSLKPKIK